MAELGAVTRALLAIARDVTDDRALAGEICRACVAGLDIDGAAISLLTADPLRETVFATDGTADLLEDLQFSLGEGACIDAAVSRRPVLVADMNDPAQTARWPVYAAAVVQQTGVRASGDESGHDAQSVRNPEASARYVSRCKNLRDVA